MLGYDRSDIIKMELAVGMALSYFPAHDKIHMGLNDTLNFLQGLEAEGYLN